MFSFLQGFKRNTEKDEATQSGAGIFCSVLNSFASVGRWVRGSRNEKSPNVSSGIKNLLKNFSENFIDQFKVNLHMDFNSHWGWELNCERNFTEFSFAIS